MPIGVPNSWWGEGFVFLTMVQCAHLDDTGEEVEVDEAGGWERG